ncbi:hypothetical protein LCGC14_0325640 [marine sediment metagenome]|uniref:Uncharacterized protein n=1 Tax=marine sediment metagenome TaxID=412755 RepID=A0A0F9WPV2_9ZZZZ
MALEHEREVIIRLKLEVDKGQAANASAEIRKVTGDATAQAEKATRAITSTTTKAVRETASATDKAMRQAERATIRARTATEQFSRELVTGLSAALRFGRGVALSFASSEEDAAKMLKSLVKIQAAFDILGGGIMMFAQLSRSMRAFTAVSQAAAASQAALAAATGARNVALTTSAGNVVSYGFGGGVVAGAAGAGGTAAISAGGFGSVVMAGGVLLAAGVALVGAASSIETAVRKSEGKKGPGTITEKVAGVFHRLNIWRQGFASIKTLKAIEREGSDPDNPFRAEVFSKRDLDRQIKRKEAQVTTEVAVGKINTQLAVLRAQQLGLRAPTDLAGATANLQQAQGPQAKAVAFQAVLDVYKQIKTTVQETARIDLRSAREKVDLLKQQLQKTEQLAKGGQKGLERFLSMTSFERQRLIGARKKLHRGTATTRDLQQLGKFRGLGMEDFDKDVSAGLRQESLRAGAGGFFDSGFLAAADQARRDVLRLEVNLQQQNLNIKIIRQDSEQEIQRISQAVKDAIAEDNLRRIKIIEQAVQNLENERAEQTKALTLN